MYFGLFGIALFIYYVHIYWPYLNISRQYVLSGSGFQDSLKERLHSDCSH